MQYFDPSATKEERIYKVVADVFSTFIVVTIIFVITQSMISR